MLYFAYGSNLNLKSMKHRCPAAKPLAAARLDGYRLQFQSYCAIVPSAGHSVPGALYELTPACVRALDAYEGSAYRHATVTVLRADTGAPVEAMVYQGATQGPPAPPTVAYAREVEIGYRDWGLDPSILRRARYDTLGVAITEAPIQPTMSKPDKPPRRALWDPAENRTGDLLDLSRPRRPPR
jgi:gamma-glutamylcyclotransferase (GGCT)/AIG2-like uncharacterized protein YtfP